ncbi:MAG: glycosyltransferase, partial [Dehalococcoidia bacterium]|nr:glycosyltransferase [Dehalococcoidia bacterium]
DYLLLLDNDTVVDPEFLTEMVKVVEADPAIDIASAMIYHYDEPDRLHLIGDKIDLWKMDTALTLGLIIGVIRRKILRRKDIYRGQYDSIKAVEHIAFWCALFKRRSVESIGLLSEEFFGFVSIEYFIRAREAGCKTVYVPRAKVWHKFRSTSKIDGFLQYDGCRGLFRVMKQYGTQWQYRFFLIQFFAVHFWLTTAYYLIWHRRPRVLLRFYKGVRDGLFNAKESLKE